MKSIILDRTWREFCSERRMDCGIPEYRFAPPRKWRFDWAWPDQQKIAMEIDGGGFIGGRHTRGAGFVNDMEKTNAANVFGWHVYHFTPNQVIKGQATDFMHRVLLAQTSVSDEAALKYVVCQPRPRRTTRRNTWKTKI